MASSSSAPTPPSSDSTPTTRNVKSSTTEIETITEIETVTEIEMLRKMASSSTAAPASADSTPITTRRNIKTSTTEIETVTEIEMLRNMASSSTAAAPASADSTPTTTRRNIKKSKFMQQQLPACRPILTPRSIILGYFLISAVFISFGIAALMASRKVVEIVYGYESDCLRNISDKVAYIQDPTTDKTCNITLKVPKDMEAPIFIYYHLENFYRNHRRYAKSKSDKQLRSYEDMNLTDGCKPEDKVNNITSIVPCGLIAWSLFNDTYSFSVNGTNLMVNKSGISWKSDREHKFGKDVFPLHFQNSSVIGGAHLNTSIPLSEQEDLIVWMRTPALPTFRKLYGRIEVDLKAGVMINVTIQNQYNTYSFNGKKKLVLSTTTWIGGKNDWIGISFLTVGGVCLFLSLFFAIGYFVKPRQLGNPSDLSWNRKQA